MTAKLDILIPTCGRPAALAVTLTSLLAQTYREFDLVISDQTEDRNIWQNGELQAVMRVLRLHGHEVRALRHLPRRGMAEQRQFLLDQARAPLVLFLDDDLILESNVIERMVLTLGEQACGFVGMAPIGLKHVEDRRPHEQEIELWQGRVQPEEVLPGGKSWQRYRLHNAANPLHIQESLQLAANDRVPYKVAWVGACVLYDREKLLSVGGYSWWQRLPAEHCGEDVLAQMLVARRFGGCGVLPSGVYHQELETTLPDRRANAPVLLARLLRG